MTDHARCRRSLADSLAEGGYVWACVGCGRRLAWLTFRGPQAGGIRFPDGIRLLPGDHDGMPRYGLPPTVLMGHEAKAGGDPAPTRRLPVYVYCPAARPGHDRCGVGQHLEGRPDASL